MSLESPIADHPASQNPQGVVSIGRPELRVAIAGDGLAQEFPIVVRRDNLRDAQRARSVLRAGTRDLANFVVAVEIEAAIAPTAASARASVRQTADVPAGGSGTIRYVGTPHGLSNLIRDIYVAEVADAVIIAPLDGSASAARIREEVLPAFAGRHVA